MPRLPPSYWRYLRACIECLERLGSPTLSNLAKVLGVSKQAVWTFQKRHPDCLAWVDEFLLENNARYYGLVQRKMAMLAMQGSAEHADRFFKSMNGGYGAKGAFGDEGAPPAPTTFTLNLLVPRPPAPGSDAAQAAAPGLALPPGTPSVIPTVKVR